MASNLWCFVLLVSIGSVAISARPDDSPSARSAAASFLSKLNNEMTLIEIALEFKKAYPDEFRAALQALSSNNNEILDIGGESIEC